RLRPGARRRVGPVRLPRSAARFRAGDRAGTAAARGGGEARLRPRRHGGPDLPSVRRRRLRARGGRRAARPGGVERVGARPHQATLLSARRAGGRRRPAARGRGERGEPHHPGLPGRAPGVPETMTGPMTPGTLRAPGAVLLLSCYELGRQPLGLAWPRAFLRDAGYDAETLDLAVEPYDAAKVARARFVGIAAPMHTALRLGVRAAERVRRANPDCFICF